MDSAAEFETMRKNWPDATLRSEGGSAAVYLPNFIFETGGKSVTMDLLLYPHSHGGSYATRLFFRERLERGPNWNPHVVCGETWYAPSWKDVHPNQSWTSMLANHLTAVA